MTGQKEGTLMAITGVATLSLSDDRNPRLFPFLPSVNVIGRQRCTCL